MQTGEIVRPTDVETLRELIGDATDTERVLEFRAGGSKRDIGAPERERTVVQLDAFTGVIDYEPSELVLTVRPATPLAEIETLLTAHGQMLAFEPWDHGVLFGRPAGMATIGGIAAAGVAGPRRVSAGGARDHLLGYAAVSGRGEAFKGGGKVVKNVTGYDTAKLIAGSWGQLAIMTELSLKVVPRPRSIATIVLPGLAPDAAVAAMSTALGSRSVPAAAAHLPATSDTPALTALRLEGFAESVVVRERQLSELLAGLGKAQRLGDDEAAELWSSIREGRPMSDATTLWRAHLAPSRANELAIELGRIDAKWLFDWGGALAWIGASADADIRSLVTAVDGHAMLVRAPREVRKTVPARHPESPAVAALAARVKQAFDPAGILDPHRFT
jgi:glycolate oxidase FAD binding subunit